MNELEYIMLLIIVLGELILGINVIYSIGSTKDTDHLHLSYNIIIGIIALMLWIVFGIWVMLIST